MLTERVDRQAAAVPRRIRIERILSVSWLGQTIASTCWIGSVFLYGLSSSGDYLQLCAASAWLIANLTELYSARAE